MAASYCLPDEKREDSLQGLRQSLPSEVTLPWHSLHQLSLPICCGPAKGHSFICVNIMEPLKGLLFLPLCLHCSPTKGNLPFLIFHAPPAINIVALKMVISNFQSSHFVFINPTSPDCVLSPLSFPEPHWLCLFLPAYNLKASSPSSIQLWKWRQPSSMEAHRYWSTTYRTLQPRRPQSELILTWHHINWRSVCMTLHRYKNVFPL